MAKRGVRVFTGTTEPAWKQYRKHTSERGIMATGPKLKSDDMPMECWCHSEIIHVAREVVRAGEGVSCGRRGCGAPG